MSRPVVMPTLDLVLRSPGCAAELPHETLCALLIQAAAVQAVLASSLVTAKESGGPPPDLASERADRWLTVSEAASVLHKSPRWFYRNANRLPFVRRLSPKSMLVSERGLQKWLDGEQRKTVKTRG